MALSTDVSLPRNCKAVFPDSCVRCGDDPAGQTIGIRGAKASWSVLFLPALFFWGGVKVQVPACGNCRWPIRFQRITSLLMTCIIVAVAVFFIWPYFEDAVAKPFRRWVVIGLGIVCLLPQIIVEICFPPPIDITVYGNKIEYEFADWDYAAEFASLNEGAESEDMTKERVEQ